jgi:acyl-CoA thioester hydrolase
MSNRRKPPARRADFKHFRTIPTRWMDNDVYGHVNNVVYYAYFDTIINHYLIDRGGLDIHNGAIIGITAETTCRFYRSFAYPEDVEAGLRVGHLGTSSVRYELGLFGVAEDDARAEGHWVHVFVERATMRPIAIPERMRAALERLKVA